MPSPAILRRAISSQVDGRAHSPDGRGDGAAAHRALTFSSETRRQGSRRRRNLRALTAPGREDHTFHIASRSDDSPSTRRRAFLRRSSSPSSSHSSSPSLDAPMPAAPTPSKGRKVADSLQLFRESAPPPSPTAEAPQVLEPARVPSKRRKEPVAEDVTAAEFEFVKRADWPEREAAVLRREKSSTALQRVRTRESGGGSSTHASGSSHGAGDETGRTSRHRRRASPSLQAQAQDDGMHDLYQWRHDVSAPQDAAAEVERGRRRARRSKQQSEPSFHIGSSGSESVTSGAPTVQDLHEEREAWLLELPESPTTARPPVYPLSPSPSRPPIDRVASEPREEPVPPPLLEDSIPFPASPIKQSRPRISTPPVQIAASDTLPTPTVSHRTYSPWSSEDESGWESNSNATTASRHSSWSLPSPSFDDAPPGYEHGHGKRALPEVFYGDDEHNGPEDSARSAGSMSPESLPHIPLQPFRNQVGGHSAIYKFTRRAVCKVGPPLSLFCCAAEAKVGTAAARVAREFVL
jgi:inositol-hexakisphosphate kinase